MLHTIRQTKNQSVKFCVIDMGLKHSDFECSDTPFFVITDVDTDEEEEEIAGEEVKITRLDLKGLGWTKELGKDGLYDFIDQLIQEHGKVTLTFHRTRGQYEK